MDTKFLTELGFTDNEIRIYLESLKTGEPITASALASRAGVNRTLCYGILKKLMGMGLVAYVLKNNVRYFKAGHPSKLLDFLKEREKKAELSIPALLSLTAPPENPYSVELFEGKEGLKTVLNDVINSGSSEFLDITSGRTVIVLPRVFMDMWHSRRVRNKTLGKVLFDDTPQGRRRGLELKHLAFTQVRYLPRGLRAPAHIYVYKDKVAISLWSKQAPFGVIIHSKEVHDRFKGFFDWLWKLSKPA